MAATVNPARLLHRGRHPQVDDLTWLLLHSVSAALRGRGGERPACTRRCRRGQCTLLRADTIERYDVDLMAERIAAHYPDRYPGVLIGPPEVAVGHLAAAAGLPWLPSGLRLLVARRATDPDAAGTALSGGVSAGTRLCAAAPGIELRQVHDPIGARDWCGSALDMRLHWTQLPAAYRRLLETQLADGAPVVVIHDHTTWPVVRVGARHTFQLGAPGRLGAHSLYQPDAEVTALFRQFGAEGAPRDVPAPGERVAEATRGIEPDLLLDVYAWSARRRVPVRLASTRAGTELGPVTAGTWRGWLAEHGRPTSRLLLGCGTQFDIWQAIRGGLVPYWCSGPYDPALDAAELWLAGGRPFDEMYLLPDDAAGGADTKRWSAMAVLAMRPGRWPPTDERRYRAARPPTPAGRTLRHLPAESPPPPLPVTALTDALHATPIHHHDPHP